jgi:hypothetical protein
MMSVVRTIVIEESALVAGEPEQVFDLVADDSNFFVLRPDAVAHRDVVSLPTGGHSCVQVYQLNKRRIEQRSVNQVFERPTRMVDTAETPWSSSVVTMSFERASGGGTIVRVRQETTPTRRIGPLAAVVSRLRGRRRLAGFLQTLNRLATARIE